MRLGHSFNRNETTTTAPTTKNGNLENLYIVAAIHFIIHSDIFWVPKRNHEQQQQQIKK